MWRHVVATVMFHSIHVKCIGFHMFETCFEQNNCCHLEEVPSCAGTHPPSPLTGCCYWFLLFDLLGSWLPTTSRLQKDLNPNRNASTNRSIFGASAPQMVQWELNAKHLARVSHLHVESMNFFVFSFIRRLGEL